MTRRIGKFATAGLLLVVGWLSWCAFSIWSFGNRDDAKPSDCAIVLGAAAYGSAPSPVFEERIRHAIDLHRRGIVTKIVFTGGTGSGGTQAESTVAAQYAIRVGVPQADILIETRSRTTKQNLAETKSLMVVHRFTSAVIVSDPLHLKRAAAMAEDLGIEAVTSPTATTRYRSMRTKLGFLLREIYFFHHYVLTGH